MQKASQILYRINQEEIDFKKLMNYLDKYFFKNILTSVFKWQTILSQ